MKKILLLVLAVFLLTGCSVENSNNETTKSLNAQEEKAVLNGQTDDKENELENVSKISEKSNDRTNALKKTDNKTSSEKKTTNKKTTGSKEQDQSSKQNNEGKNKKKHVEKVPQKDNKEEKHKHMFTVNGGWYKTSDEAYRKFQSLSDQWNKKYESGEIGWDEYCKNCPNGYEIYRCICGMHGLNLTYN